MTFEISNELDWMSASCKILYRKSGDQDQMRKLGEKIVSLALITHNNCSRTYIQLWSIFKFASVNTRNCADNLFLQFARYCTRIVLVTRASAPFRFETSQLTKYRKMLYMNTIDEIDKSH